MPKISALPAADALSGDELVPVVQDGATARTTVQALADYANAPAPDTVIIHQRWRLTTESGSPGPFSAEALPLNTADLPTSHHVTVAGVMGTGEYLISGFGSTHDWDDGLQVPLLTFDPAAPDTAARLVVGGSPGGQVLLRTYDASGGLLTDGVFVVDVLLVFPAA